MPTAVGPCTVCPQHELLDSDSSCHSWDGRGMASARGRAKKSEEGCAPPGLNLNSWRRCPCGAELPHNVLGLWTLMPQQGRELDHVLTRSSARHILQPSFRKRWNMHGLARLLWSACDHKISACCSCSELNFPERHCRLTQVPLEAL